VIHRKPIALAGFLVLLTLLALGLRFTGIGFMLPHLTEPDDFVLAQLEAA